MKKENHITVCPASVQHAPAIARLVMTAMTDECCLNLAGAGNTLADFARMMNLLTAMPRSQYSYRNTLVAIDGSSGTVAGAIVAYDGARLHELRRPFIDAAARLLHTDHSGMDDETAPGEWYIDSLAVLPPYRGQGIAHRLLEAAVSLAARHRLPAALLVDKGNPKAERLYRSVGFNYVDDAQWGGHDMRHLRTEAPSR